MIQKMESFSQDEESFLDEFSRYDDEMKKDLFRSCYSLLCDFKFVYQASFKLKKIINSFREINTSLDFEVIVANISAVAEQILNCEKVYKKNCQRYKVGCGVFA